MSGPAGCGHAYCRCVRCVDPMITTYREKGFTVTPYTFPRELRYDRKRERSQRSTGASRGKQRATSSAPTMTSIA